MKYRKILIKYNVYLKKLYFIAVKIQVVFYGCENTSCISRVNWMSYTFSIDFLEPTSDFQMPITFLSVDKNTKCGYSFS